MLQQVFTAVQKWNTKFEKNFINKNFSTGGLRNTFTIMQ